MISFKIAIKKHEDRTYVVKQSHNSKQKIFSEKRGLHLCKFS